MTFSISEYESKQGIPVYGDALADCYARAYEELKEKGCDVSTGAVKVGCHQDFVNHILTYTLTTKRPKSTIPKET